MARQLYGYKPREEYTMPPLVTYSESDAYEEALSMSAENHGERITVFKWTNYKWKPLYEVFA